MQQGQQGDGEHEKSEKELKREAADCKRCERWRDELTRESEYTVHVHAALNTEC